MIKINLYALLNNRWRTKLND